MEAAGIPAGPHRSPKAQYAFEVDGPCQPCGEALPSPLVGVNESAYPLVMARSDNLHAMDMATNAATIRTRRGGAWRPIWVRRSSGRGPARRRWKGRILRSSIGRP